MAAALNNWKVGGSIPGSFSLHVKVLFGKILNPDLALMAVSSVCVSQCKNVMFVNGFLH